MRMKVIEYRDGSTAEVDMDAVYDAAWEAVDEDVKERAVEALHAAFDIDALAEVYQGVAKYGRHNWPSKPPFTPEPDPDDEFSFLVSWHHSVGTSVRNELRLAGLTDDLLPDNAMDVYYGEGTNVKNLDDYYVQALEAAAGAR